MGVDCGPYGLLGYGLGLILGLWVGRTVYRHGSR